jgi:hypothetical protein
MQALLAGRGVQLNLLCHRCLPLQARPRGPPRHPLPTAASSAPGRRHSTAALVQRRRAQPALAAAAEGREVAGQASLAAALSQTAAALTRSTELQRWRGRNTTKRGQGSCSAASRWRQAAAACTAAALPQNCSRCRAQACLGCRGWQQGRTRWGSWASVRHQSLLAESAAASPQRGWRLCRLPRPLSISCSCPPAALLRATSMTPGLCPLRPLQCGCWTPPKSLPQLPLRRRSPAPALPLTGSAQAAAPCAAAIRSLLFGTGCVCFDIVTSFPWQSPALPGDSNFLPAPSMH